MPGSAEALIEFGVITARKMLWKPMERGSDLGEISFPALQ